MCLILQVITFVSTHLKINEQRLRKSATNNNTKSLCYDYHSSKHLYYCCSVATQEANAKTKFPSFTPKLMLLLTAHLSCASLHG